MDYDVLAFIGRFQPFHNGHKAVVDQALTRAKKVAIVIGSDGQPRNSRNPFTTAERIEMIRAVFPDEVRDGRIHFAAVPDHPYNMDRWIKEVTAKVQQIAQTPFTPDPVKIGLIGHSKDHTSFYLKSFPTWGSIEVENVAGINATDIREDYFRSDTRFQTWMLPNAVADQMRRFSHYTELQSEFYFISDYKAQFASYPYPPTFHTVDAVVTQSGHILLVKRGAHPGKGLWALPGGFLEQTETLREGMLRELKEETRIAVPLPVLDGSVRGWRTFDDPHRSLRGRTITTAFHVDLRHDTTLPKIKGSDDAVKAQWVPLANLSRSAMFEDHYAIIETTLGI